MSPLGQPNDIFSVEIHREKDKYRLTRGLSQECFQSFDFTHVSSGINFVQSFQREMEPPNKSTLFLICSSSQIPSVLPIFYIPTPNTQGIKAWKPQIKNKSSNPGDKWPTTAQKSKESILTGITRSNGISEI